MLILGWGFAAPGLLWGMGLASAPILIHLFFRRRHREIDWAAMRWLLEAIKKQYRNMLEHLKKEPRSVKLAEQAIRNVGVEPNFESIRGGTDGSRLSEMGLPTPNLSVGMHNFHSELEFACLEQMETAVKVLVELAKLWGKEK